MAARAGVVEDLLGAAGGEEGARNAGEVKSIELDVRALHDFCPFDEVALDELLNWQCLRWGNLAMTIVGTATKSAGQSQSSDR
jgi:hypothetical protein